MSEFIKNKNLKKMLDMSGRNCNEYHHTAILWNLYKRALGVYKYISSERGVRGRHTSRDDLRGVVETCQGIKLAKNRLQSMELAAYESTVVANFHIPGCGETWLSSRHPNC